MSRPGPLHALLSLLWARLPLQGLLVAGVLRATAEPDE